MSAFESGENITSLFTNPKPTKENFVNMPEEIPEPEPEEETLELPTGDHPAIKFFDFAIAAAIPICEKADVAPPDKVTYDTFGRDCINEAAWNYLPVGEGETPKWLSLVLAAGCLLIIFSPTAVSLIEKQKQNSEDIAEPLPEPHKELPKLPGNDSDDKEITEPIV